MRRPVLLAAAAAVTLTGGAVTQQVPERPARRPYPHAIEVPPAFLRAVNQGTRTMTGRPGPDYWQQRTDYTLRARIDVEAKLLDGNARIVYHNNSPRPMPFLWLQTTWNVHQEGAMRNRPAEVTGGVEIEQITVQGEVIPQSSGRASGAGYRILGTRLQMRLPSAIRPGDSAVVDIDWRATIPQRGGRYGWNRDNLFYLAYWYPQLAVYDDVGGWQTDAFLGTAEFYMGYGDYDVTLEAPEGWLVMATGELTNPDEVLPENIVERVERAQQSDTVVHVMTPADFGPGTATRRSDTGYLSWNFVSENVRDVAVSVTSESRWDAARINVGDRDGDGSTDYAQANAIWREGYDNWQAAWRYVQHSIDFHSRWMGFPYPWPHMTSIEGDGIMGGGMEFPMMTLIGGYNGMPEAALYGVHTHELAHMWFPMIVGLDERRYAWMDEGTTSFNTSQSENEFYPDAGDHHAENRDGYAGFARTGLEGEIIRWSDLQGPMAYGVASYPKPAAVLASLRAVLGEDVFVEAFRSFITDWAYKHPQPWDLFNAFERVAGQDLDWFWRTWYYETWTLDQAIGSVTSEGNRTTITVEDYGWAPMPVKLTITLRNGDVMHAEVSVEHWLEGSWSAEVTVTTPSPVAKVEIDAEGYFPDTNRRNNVWERT
jgi:hypothetical protein